MVGNLKVTEPRASEGSEPLIEVPCLIGGRFFVSGIESLLEIRMAEPAGATTCRKD